MTNRTTEVACLSWGEVCARRLDRHALSAPLQDARPADIVGTICGAHAQVLSAAELSIGLRLAGITRTDIREALWTERSLIKTFGPRGTVHLLPTQDLPMWTGALSAIPPSRNSQAKDVRLTPEQTEQVVEAIAIVLDDAELTIDELSEAVIASTGPWAGDLAMLAFGGMWPRWRQALTTAADRGALCFGPHHGSKITYTNPRRWLPGFRPADGQIALAAIVRRYLHAYGPANPQQFAQWLGTPRRWAMELFDSLSTELQQDEINGTLAWLATRDTTVSPMASHSVRLLPYFDAYTVGCQTRTDSRWPSRKLPGAAHRRDGCRGLAPAPLWPKTRHHSGAIRQTHRHAAPRPRRAGGTHRGIPRRPTPVDHRHCDRRRSCISRVLGQVRSAFERESACCVPLQISSARECRRS